MKDIGEILALPDLVHPYALKAKSRHMILLDIIWVYFVDCQKPVVSLRSSS